MSFLSKAGERFKLNLKRVPKFRLGQYEKLQNKSHPPFLRPDVKIDIQADNSVPTDFSKLKYLVGDRVMIVKGPKKGSICKVSRHVEGNGYILDENGPTNTVAIPKMFWQEGQKSHIVTYPRAVSGDNLRLVAEIEDEKTGQMKTVAVENLEFKGQYYDEDYKKVLKYRTVKGQNDLHIPYPRPDPKEEGQLCTEVDNVRERTYFVESAVKSSIPEDALLTIRNPHSKYRRAKLTKLDVKRLTPPSMPLSETRKAYWKEKRELSKLPKVNITDEMKAFLGAKIREHEKVKAKQFEEVSKL